MMKVDRSDGRPILNRLRWRVKVFMSFDRGSNSLSIMLIKLCSRILTGEATRSPLC